MRPDGTKAERKKREKNAVGKSAKRKKGGKSENATMNAGDNRNTNTNNMKKK